MLNDIATTLFSSARRVALPESTTSDHPAGSRRTSISRQSGQKSRGAAPSAPLPSRRTSRRTLARPQPGSCTRRSRAPCRRDRGNAVRNAPVLRLRPRSCTNRFRFSFRAVGTRLPAAVKPRDLRPTTPPPPFLRPNPFGHETCFPSYGLVTQSGKASRRSFRRLRVRIVAAARHAGGVRTCRSGRTPAQRRRSHPPVLDRGPGSRQSNSVGHWRRNNDRLHA